MLFLVPDDSPVEEEVQQKTESSGEEAASSDSASSDTAAGGEGARGVELDLDDAPFLVDDEPKTDSEAPSTPEEQKEKESSGKPEDAPKQSFIKRLLSNKKLLIIAGGGVLLLIIIAVALIFFLGGSKEESAPESAASEVAAEKEAPAEKEAEEAPPNPIIFKVENGTGEPPTILPYPYLISWEPFLVPLNGSEGEVRLLTCTISIPVEEEELHAEIESKKRPLRDAVYYFLSHRPFYLLDTEEAQATLKKDIVSVINERVTSSKVKDILIQNYLVQGP